jgi:hypothetical protein
MSQFARRYTFYFFIVAGAMVMALIHLSLGSYTASVIYGTELTEATISTAGWFSILAPAFLAWLDGGGTLA